MYVCVYVCMYVCMYIYVRNVNVTDCDMVILRYMSTTVTLPKWSQLFPPLVIQQTMSMSVLRRSQEPSIGTKAQGSLTELWREGSCLECAIPIGYCELAA